MAELVLIYDSVTGGFISKQVGADHIANAAIVSAKVASGAIGGAHMAAGAILSANIASGSIGSSHLGYSPGATTSGLTSSEHASVIHVSGQIGSGQIANIHLRTRARDRLFTSGTNYVIPGWYANAMSVVQPTIGDLYHIPIYVPSLWTYTGIVCHVASALAGVTVRMGVYAWSGGGPGALVLDAGTVSAATTGAKEIIISLTLDAGWYFLTFTCNGLATMRTIDAATAAVPPLGGGENLAGLQPEVIIPAGRNSNATLSGLITPAEPALAGYGIDGFPAVWLREG